MSGKEYDVERRLNDLIARGCVCGMGICKPGDTSRNSGGTGTTLTADPDLTLPVEANAMYKFAMFLAVDGAGPGTGDFKWQFTLPAGALRYRAIGLNLDATVIRTASTVMSVNMTGAGNLNAVELKGFVTVGAGAGSLTLLWAQNTAGATSTIVRQGSWIELVRRA